MTAPALHRHVASLWQGLLLCLMILGVCLGACLGVCAPARAADAPGVNHISAQLLAEHGVAPGGTVTLAIHFTPEKSYHGYWQNPGDAGLGTVLTWTGPGKAGVARYPVPETLLISGLMNHVYQSDFALLVPYTMPADTKAGSEIPLKLKADWLACTDTMCVPESGEMSTVLKVTQPGAEGASDPRFDGWRAKLPAPLGAAAHWAIAGDSLRLAIPFPASGKVEAPHFFAATENAVAYAGAQSFSRKGDMLIVTLKRAGQGALKDLSGVLRLNGAGDGVEVVASEGMGSHRWRSDCLGRG